MTQDALAVALGAAVVGLRMIRGLKGCELGAKVGLAKNMLSRYENGKQTLPPWRLAQMLHALDFTGDELEEVLEPLRRLAVRESRPASPLAPTREERLYIQKTGAAARRIAEEDLERYVAELNAARARLEAEETVRTLLSFPPAERLVLVEHRPEYQTWAVVECLCWESKREAANDPGKALSLADLARRAAERSEPEGPCRQRTCGYVWVYVGNARRVKNDHDESREAFARAWKLWKAGAAAAALPLEEWRLWELEASLLIRLLKLDRALENLEKALSLAPPEAGGQILLQRAHVWHQKLEHEKALADLEKAAPQIEENGAPLHRFALEFNRAATLRHLERYQEASRLLPGVRARVKELGQELHLVRVLWLEGVVAAGLGRIGEGLAMLERVEAEFRRREMAYDGALVNLDIAELELSQGKASQVKQRAAAMWWIFRDKGVHREALAALRVFCEAAQQEAATAELARKVRVYLEKALYEPQLRFEA